MGHENTMEKLCNQIWHEKYKRIWIQKPFFPSAIAKKDLSLSIYYFYLILKRDSIILTKITLKVQELSNSQTNFSLLSFRSIFGRSSDHHQTSVRPPHNYDPPPIVGPPPCEPPSHLLEDHASPYPPLPINSSTHLPLFGNSWNFIWLFAWILMSTSMNRSWIVDLKIMEITWILMLNITIVGIG